MKKKPAKNEAAAALARQKWAKIPKAERSAMLRAVVNARWAAKRRREAK
jgi:hypothetical protein